MLLRLIASIFLLSAALTGCATAGAGSTANGSPTIATHAFASNRATNFNYRISPDGTRLAWLGVDGAALVLKVRQLDSGRTVTRDAHGVLSFAWSADSRSLLSNSLTAVNTENHLIVAFDADDDGGDHANHSAMRVLAARVGVDMRLVGTVAADADSLIVEHNQRDPAHPDLFRLSIASRALTLIETNDGTVTGWLLRADGAVGGRRVQTDGGEALQLRQGDSIYRTIYQWGQNDQVGVVSLSSDGATSYLLSNKQASRVRLIAIDHASGAERVVADDEGADLAGVDVDPASGVPVLVASEPDYPRYQALNGALAAALAQLPIDGPARVALDSADHAFSKAVVAVATSRGRSVYLADLAARTVTMVGPPSTASFAHALAPMTPIRFSARDGVPVHGYLSRPAANAANPALPPLVLRVHGGPWERTVWNYDPLTQLLVNRGYAVLDVNFRGSTGYGRAFTALGGGQWGRAMQTDLYDAVAWAGAAGLADTARSAILGASYGGYASATAILDASTPFKCAIAINAPLELDDMVATLPARFEKDRTQLLRYLGADSGELAWRERSPGSHAARLRRPLLLVQGAGDVRVNPQQASRFAAAAQAANAPLRYWPVAGAGHQFSSWKTTLALYRRTEQFLAACLGGRDAGFDYYELGTFLF